MYTRIIIVLLIAGLTAASSCQTPRNESETSAAPTTDGETEVQAAEPDTNATEEPAPKAAWSDYSVERVRLVETVDNSYESHIPRLVVSGEGRNAITDTINTWLMDRYMIESYDQARVETFRWYDADFESQIQDSLLFIHFWGEYYGAYPSPVDESLYFSLNTGEQLTMPGLPFHKLFTPEGYTTFIRKFWLPEVREDFDEAIACADSEPYCSILDVATYSIEDNKLSMALTDDCYPRVVQACAPSTSLSVPVDSARPYLSVQGEKALLQDSIQSLSGARRFTYLNDLLPKLQNNVFLYGKIAGNYPITMALTLSPDGTAQGFYYYDQKQQPITLRGKKVSENTYRIEEYAEGENTGRFTIISGREYLRDAIYSVDDNHNMTYWKASWTSADGTREYPVELEAVKN